MSHGGGSYKETKWEPDEWERGAISEILGDLTLMRNKADMAIKTLKALGEVQSEKPDLGAIAAERAREAHKTLVWAKRARKKTAYVDGFYKAYRAIAELAGEDMSELD